MIVDNLIEGTDTSYNWQASDLPEGDYYIYAKIEDGINHAVYTYSEAALRRPPMQVKLNDTGVIRGWGSSDNNCTSVNIAQQDCSHGRDAQALRVRYPKWGGAGFDFTRLNADGSDYRGNGDYKSQPWACARDNHTGLIWEVKTTDGGIHDKDNRYVGAVKRPWLINRRETMAGALL